MFILLSSVGLASSIAPTTQANVVTDGAITKIDTNKRDNFIDNLKVNVTNESIVDSLIEKRQQEYSKDTGYGEKVKEFLVKVLNAIDENFEMNASKKGSMALTKEEYKTKIISLIENIGDIVVVDTNVEEENQYTKLFEKRSEDVAACYVRNEISNDLGFIPKNIMLIKNGKKWTNTIDYTVIHELMHSIQGTQGKMILIQYDNIMSMLKEGHANYNAEYVRDINLESFSNSIENVSLTTYDIPSVLYNKLSYLVGEKEMNKYMEDRDVSLYELLLDKLDEKYGKGTGDTLYKHITNLSFWFDNYYEELKEENIGKIFEKQYKEIESKKNKITERIMNNKGDISSLNKAKSVNDNYELMLDNIRLNIENGNGYEIAIKEALEKELKGIEILTLECINKDVENISSKNQVLDYVQSWDYYRNRCAISKDYTGQEETSKSGNFKLLYKVQHNLYDKCIEYKALNIKDEKLFDKLLESQLYDVNSSRISYNKKKTKCEIADKYLINEIDIMKTKKGDKKYSMWKTCRNKNGKAKGTKILADRDKEQER